MSEEIKEDELGFDQVFQGDDDVKNVDMKELVKDLKEDIDKKESDSTDVENKIENPVDLQDFYKQDDNDSYLNPGSAFGTSISEEPRVKWLSMSRHVAEVAKENVNLPVNKKYKIDSSLEPTEIPKITRKTVQTVSEEDQMQFQNIYANETDELTLYTAFGNDQNNPKPKYPNPNNPTTTPKGSIIEPTEPITPTALTALLRQRKKGSPRGTLLLKKKSSRRFPEQQETHLFDIKWEQVYEEEDEMEEVDLEEFVEVYLAMISGNSNENKEQSLEDLKIENIYSTDETDELTPRSPFKTWDTPEVKTLSENHPETLSALIKDSAPRHLSPQDVSKLVQKRPMSSPRGTLFVLDEQKFDFQNTQKNNKTLRIDVEDTFKVEKGVQVDNGFDEDDSIDDLLLGFEKDNVNDLRSLTVDMREVDLSGAILEPKKKKEVEKEVQREVVQEERDSAWWFNVLNEERKLFNEILLTVVRVTATERERTIAAEKKASEAQFFNAKVTFEREALIEENKKLKKQLARYTDQLTEYRDNSKSSESESESENDEAEWSHLKIDLSASNDELNGSIDELLGEREKRIMQISSSFDRALEDSASDFEGSRDLNQDNNGSLDESSSGQEKREIESSVLKSTGKKGKKLGFGVFRGKNQNNSMLAVAAIHEALRHIAGKKGDSKIISVLSRDKLDNNGKLSGKNLELLVENVGLKRKSVKPPLLNWTFGEGQKMSELSVESVKDTLSVHELNGLTLSATLNEMGYLDLFMSERVSLVQNVGRKLANLFNLLIYEKRKQTKLNEISSKSAHPQIFFHQTMRSSDDFESNGLGLPIRLLRNCVKKTRWLEKSEFFNSKELDNFLTLLSTSDVSVFRFSFIMIIICGKCLPNSTSREHPEQLLLKVETGASLVLETIYNEREICHQINPLLNPIALSKKQLKQIKISFQKKSKLLKDIFDSYLIKKENEFRFLFIDSVIQFCRDYLICPDFLIKSQVIELFKASTKSPGFDLTDEKSQKIDFEGFTSEDETITTKTIKNGLNFSQFLEFLLLIATRSSLRKHTIISNKNLSKKDNLCVKCLNNLLLLLENPW